MSCYKDTLQTCGRQRLNVTEYKSTHYIPPFESAWGMWVKDRAKDIKKRYEKNISSYHQAGLVEQSS